MVVVGSGGRGGGAAKGWGWGGLGAAVEGTHPLRRILSAIFLLLALYIFKRKNQLPWRQIWE